MSTLHSCLYDGWVSHRRYEPRGHAFRYRLFMCYLDLAELPQLFDRYWLWSARRPAPAWFRRADYLQSAAHDAPLDEAVRDLVAARTGMRPAGPVRLLTHLRYFGHCFNPVSFYYCYAADGHTVQAIVAEITNTPWKERHAYVLPVADGARASWEFRFGKTFHVSPFMPMQLDYDWHFAAPGDALTVRMRNLDGGRRVFAADLQMERRALSSAALAHALLRFPAITAQVTAQIYWQALRLALKRTPSFTHPASPVYSQEHGVDVEPHGCRREGRLPGLHRKLW